MQEIYRNSPNRVVTLNAPVTPVPGTMVVTAEKNGELLHIFDTVTSPEAGVFTVTLPFFLVQYDREIQVHWNFDYVEGTETYSYEELTGVKVVTPLLSLAEIKAINPDLDDEAATILESTIRYIIQSITGQSFGHFVGTKSFVGNGDKQILLPDRLISFTAVETSNFTYNVNAYHITGGGWYLRQAHNALLGVKEYPSDYALDEGPVITTPYSSYYRGFRQDTRYDITGSWGYVAVPNDVKMAARLLAEDYGCPEVAYRDNFITYIKSADWLMRFSGQTWEYTGNVRADKLLAPYIRLDWAIV